MADKKREALPVSPTMAIGFAVSAALSEMVTKGVITSDDAKAFERRADELINGLFRGEVLTIGENGLYTLTPRTAEQLAKYPLPPEMTEDDALVIGD